MKETKDGAQAGCPFRQIGGRPAGASEGGEEKLQEPIRR